MLQFSGWCTPITFFTVFEVHLMELSLRQNSFRLQYSQFDRVMFIPYEKFTYRNHWFKLHIFTILIELIPWQCVQSLYNAWFLRTNSFWFWIYILTFDMQSRLNQTTLCLITGSQNNKSLLFWQLPTTRHIKSTRWYPWGIQWLVSSQQSPAQYPPWEVSVWVTFLASFLNLPEVPKSSLRSPMGGILCQEYPILGFLATFVSQWPKLCITYSLSHTMCVETNNASSYSSEMLVSTFQDSALTYRDFPTIYRLSHCAHSS